MKIKDHDKTPGYIYIFKSDYVFKIGMSNNPKKRFEIIRQTNPTLISIAEYKTEYKVECEKGLHRLFKDKRFRGEWFELTKEDLWRIEPFVRNDEWQHQAFVKDKVKTSSDMEKFTLSLPEVYTDKLAKLAQTEDRSRNSLIRRIIKEYLEDQKNLDK
ncbi:hypothetical protein LCGC14_2542140 [marine sediment metagenome]|uniref:Ribbon-helix-helix protein CopG domain-containing protein n=1 Tax=marine sediment metagenome TaxID=412755 RepID=A0A0F9D1Z5_9ZZZZ